MKSMNFFSAFATPVFFIDVFQDTKRNLTNQIIKDPTINKVANNFIDAQTEFAKMLANNTVDVLKYSVESIYSHWFPKKD